MATSVPSIEDFIASFPTPLPKIDGPPTYESLKQTRDILKINAASVPSNRGGGQNGYLGLVVSAGIYATITNIPFTLPANPGPQPIIPVPAPTAAVVGAIIRAHTEDFREWREYNNVQAALKKQLINSIDPIYLRAKKDRHVGFNNISLRELLSFLFTTYGALQPQDLLNNQKEINTPWDPNTPFETLIDQIEECAEFAEAGNQPYTAPQILNTAYTLVYNTGMFFEDCKLWNRKPDADKTWVNFKTHFLEAQRELRLQQQTTKQAGYQANLSYQQENVEQQHRDTAEALANLATATSTDRQAFAALAVTNENLSQQLKEAMQEIKDLKALVAKGKRTPTMYRKNNNYCWTHGYRVTENHTSATCNKPAEGHKKEATRANTMGGNQRGKE